MSGRCFEEFEPGEMFQSRGRTITETDVVNFCGLSGDFIPFHTDEEFARTTMFGKRIAAGAMVFSISTGLMAQMDLLHDTILAYYGIDKLRFTKPVFIGDTIRITKKVLEKQEKGEGRGVVTFETYVLNQRGEPVVVYYDKLMIRKRG